MKLRWSLVAGALILIAGSCVSADTADTADGAEVQGVLYGFGQAASADEIATLDIDVNPAGDGLPEGEGTVSAGEVVYRQRCLACHGPTGVEGPNGVLVGRLPDDAFPFANDPRVRLTIGNYWPYATTLFDYVNRAMPFDTPGSLSADEVYSVVALLLNWNEIVPGDAVMNASTLPEVVMPSRDRFVRDKRTGGPTIR